MKKLIVPFFVLCLLSISNRAGAALAVDLVTNGDFSAGLANWGVFSFNGDKVDETINANGGTLNWLAVNATDGNATGAVQNINADVSVFDSLVFQANVNPLSQSVDSPGGGGFDFPVRVDIEYIDTGGVGRVFRHGFFNSGTDSAQVPGTQLAPNGSNDSSTWFLYTSPDLMTLPDTPKTISNLVLLGAGFNYEGRVDNVKLTGTVVPEPATASLLVLGVSAAAFRRRL